MQRNTDKVCLINSCSGGKTSSYMYLKYPADYTVFAFVESNSPENQIKDSGLLKIARQKLNRDVTGSMELEATIKAMVELEQLGGREINWVTAGFSYEDLVLGKVDIPKHRNPMLPNSRLRFCTQYLKVFPIFEWCFLNMDDFIVMNIGYRADEASRVKAANCDRLNNIFYPQRCDIVGRHSGQHRWQKYEWREVVFPLYNAGITKLEVDMEMAKTGIKFPFVSNCVGCFFHTAQEMLYQERANPGLLAPWARLEEQVGATFRKGVSVQDILAGKRPAKKEPGSCLCGETVDEGQLNLLEKTDAA